MPVTIALADEEVVGSRQPEIGGIQMAQISMLPEVPVEDSVPIRWAPWLTQRRLTLFVIGWLTLFAVIGVFISNPFQSEPNASAGPSYATVMFLHGLLIGMVGLMSLLACQVLRFRSPHVRLWIAGGTVVATVLAAVGGIWDKTVPGSEVPMWTQIFGFFALDEILLTLLVGLVVEWRGRTAGAFSLPFVVAFVSALAMFFAALMGHLAGWIMEFGWNFPPLIKHYAQFAGFGSQDDFTGALVGSHSHEMAVGVMALTIALAAQQFGYGALRGLARGVARLGLALVAFGVVSMSAIYIYGGINNWSPPAWFVSGPNGVNGIASDDVVTGVLVMGGGVLVVLAFAFLRSVIHQPVRMAALWAWVLSFATVVGAGFYIELHTNFFGAGDQTAAGADNDAIFTWLHQDIGLFLLPALVLVMLAVDRLVSAGGRRTAIGWAVILGTTTLFAGAMVWVFVNPALHGPGYVVSTAGVLFIGAALLATLWWGALRPKAARVPVSAVPSAGELHRTAPLWTTPPTPEAVPASPKAEDEKVPAHV
jgi:hypothetical protein